LCLFFFSSRRRHTRSKRDWSSDVCSSDLRWWNPAHWTRLTSTVMTGRGGHTSPRPRYVLSARLYGCVYQKDRETKSSMRPKIHSEWGQTTRSYIRLRPTHTLTPPKSRWPSSKPPRHRNRYYFPPSCHHRRLPSCGRSHTT